MESADVNWLAVVVAAIVPMVLGALWYSPVLFAGPWLRAVGRTMEELSGARLGYALSAVAALVTSAVLAYVVDWAEATSFVDGVFTGLIVWLGFVATVLGVTTYFGGRPLALWAINAGYQLVSYALMGAILAAWD
jgi:uncharacterized protein DUF1761